MQGKPNNKCAFCNERLGWKVNKIRIVSESYTEDITNIDRKGKVKFENLAQYHTECYKKLKGDETR
jgi:hypothetical protein